MSEPTTVTARYSGDRPEQERHGAEREQPAHTRERGIERFGQRTSFAAAAGASTAITVAANPTSVNSDGDPCPSRACRVQARRCVLEDHC